MDLLWTSDLAIGVDTIDEQHRELLKRLNDLRSAINQGKGKEEIENTFTFLADYAIEHFSAEERYMTKYGYPGYRSHKAEHESFIKNFLELRKKFTNLEQQRGITSFLVIEMQRHLYDWLINHIGKVDKALGRYLLDVM